MEFYPTKEEALRYAAEGEYRVLPVCCELLSDQFTPIEVLRILKNVSAHAFLLESVSEHHTNGRYTFLGYDPKLEISAIDGKLKAGDMTLETDNPGAYLRQLLREYASPKLEGLPPFTGGLVGYFSYDYLCYQEPSVKTAADDPDQFRDLDLMLFDKVIAFDHFRQKLILIANMKLSEPETGYNKAVLALQQTADLIRSGKKCQEPKSRITGEMTALFDKQAYCAMVEKAKYHIHEGDIFQIVLSNRFSAPFEGTLLNTYRMLRTINPSPYMF